MADDNNKLTLLQEAAASIAASDIERPVEDTELPEGFFDGDDAEILDSVEPSVETVTQVIDGIPDDDTLDDASDEATKDENAEAKEAAEAPTPEGQTRPRTRTRRRTAVSSIYTGGQAQVVETSEDAIARQEIAVRNNPRAIYTGEVIRVTERNGKLAVEIKNIEIMTMGSRKNINLPDWTAIIAPQHFMENTEQIEALAQLKGLLTNWEGGRVEFMPINTDTVKTNFKDRLIAGDRNAAQNLLIRHHWLNRNGISKGRKVQGTITFVAPRVIGVSAFGVNQLLPASRCLPAGLYSSDLRTYVDLNEKEPYFQTGKPISLYVDELKRVRTENGGVSLSVSLSTELSHANDNLNLDEYRHGDPMTGYVDGIGTNNGITVYVRLAGVRLTVRCGWGSEYAVPERGMKVRVRIAKTVTMKDSGRKILVGNIMPR